MKKLKLVMIGNGNPGVRTIEELLKIAPDLYDICIFGAEPHPNYNRILLSPVLSGEQTLDQIILNDLDWYEQNHIRLHLGKTVTQINRKERFVVAADGTREDYDRLLFATGSLPFILPVPGNDLPGVISYRDIKDTNEISNFTELKNIKIEWDIKLSQEYKYFKWEFCFNIKEIKQVLLAIKKFRIRKRFC